VNQLGKKRKPVAGCGITSAKPTSESPASEASGSR
jgi:hypothetical protein